MALCVGLHATLPLPRNLPSVSAQKGPFETVEDYNKALATFHALDDELDALSHMAKRTPAQQQRKEELETWIDAIAIDF
jgi:hypothetical protein